ncbi:MAG: DUF3488 domain-containing protein [Bryobacterales bacterium]|nr:DUF3488 domain-containing protein [Acidobacteriota bacterium]MCB9385771.1 DUF3488 domain-containing protein [Bryobacterales bacterium]
MAAARQFSRFFELLLWALLANGLAWVWFYGGLDSFTGVAVTGVLVGALLRTLGKVRFRFPRKATTVVALAVIGFYPLDVLYLSGDFVGATVRLMFLLTAVKIVIAATARDYLYLGMLAFLQLLTASMFVVGLAFLVNLGIFLVLAATAYATFEIGRGAAESERIVGGTPPNLGRRMFSLGSSLAAGILVASAGLFFLLPRVQLGAPLHLPGGHFVGFSNEVNLGATGSLSADPTPVMRVQPLDSEDLSGLHWRGVALFRFDGERWSAPQAGARVLEAGAQGMHLGHERRVDEGRRLRYRVALEPLATDAIFLAGQPEQVRGRFTKVIITDSGDLHVPDSSNQGINYEAQTWLPDLDRLQPSDVVELFGADFQAKYLQLPELDPRIAELNRQVLGDARAPLRKARAIESYLRTNFGYSLDLPSRKHADPLAYFLFERKEGHCEYFASAMALMLRLEGIPSRVVNGFLGGVWNDLSGMQVLRSSDAHSWVEAYIPGYGWLEFDPTPPAPEANAGLMSNLWMYWDAVESAWMQWVVGYDSSRQRDLARTFQEGSAEAAVDAMLRWEDVKRRLAAWLDAAAQTLGAGAGLAGRAIIAGALLALAGAALLWGLPALRLWLRRRRVATGHASVNDCRYFYERALAILEKRGFKRGKAQTAEEFLSGISDTSLRGLLEAVIRAYNAARFGGDGEAERKLPGLVRELERVKV